MARLKKVGIIAGVMIIISAVMIFLGKNFSSSGMVTAGKVIFFLAVAAFLLALIAPLIPWGRVAAATGAWITRTAPIVWQALRSACVWVWGFIKRNPYLVAAIATFLALIGYLYFANPINLLIVGILAIAVVGLAAVHFFGWGAISSNKALSWIIASVVYTAVVLALLFYYDERLNHPMLWLGVISTGLAAITCLKWWGDIGTWLLNATKNNKAVTALVVSVVTIIGMAYIMPITYGKVQGAVLVLGIVATIVFLFVAIFVGAWKALGMKAKFFRPW